MIGRDWTPGTLVSLVGPYGKMVGGTGREVWPQKGPVYTIREIGFLHPVYTRHLAVRLVEVVNEPARYWGHAPWEICFAAARFRKLDDSRIDIFRSHLVDAPNELEMA